MQRLAAWIVVGLAGTGSVGSAVWAAERSVPPAVVPEAVGAPSRLPPARWVETMAAAPLASLRPASVAALDALEALWAWNASGRRPIQNGFSRPLPLPRRVSLGAASAAPTLHAGGVTVLSAEGELLWAAHVEVAGAYRLRLHLADVELPAGTRLWVYSGEESVGPFGLELLGPDGDLWTPSVAGPRLSLEVRLPTAAQSPGETARFALDRVLELVEPDTLTGAAPEALTEELTRVPAASHDASCLVDATCVGANTFGNIDAYRRAVAHLEYVRGGDSFICTGGLLNDTDDSAVVPYLLTANHCFSAQASAATLEAFWDYRTATCGGLFPNLGTLPRSNGSTLLATSVQTDFTLVRLGSIPGGRLLLGWTTAPVAAGTMLHRLSHPAPDDFPRGAAQAYSQTRVTGPQASFSCGGADEDGRPLDDPAKFLKAAPVLGGTFGGSSGAPVVLANGQVVGQLFGSCGPGFAEGCSLLQSEVDGAFRSTFPAVSQFLDPAPGGGTEPCVAGPTTLCLTDDRFRVEVDWRTRQGNSGAGRAVELTPDTGYFWFFNAANVEMVIKVLDACGFANRFWVFAGGLTNVETEITVTDTETGWQKFYRNPQSTPFEPVQDTEAFATCP